MHYNEIHNRLAKARRILTTLDERGYRNPLILATLDNDVWNDVAALTGDNPPSNATISAVIAMAEGRQMAIDAIQLHYTPAGRENP